MNNIIGVVLTALEKFLGCPLYSVYSTAGGNFLDILEKYMGIFPWLSRTAGENFLDIPRKYLYGHISVVIQNSWGKFP